MVGRPRIERPAGMRHCTCIHSPGYSMVIDETGPHKHAAANKYIKASYAAHI
jgi:hypothetical protein